MLGAASPESVESVISSSGDMPAVAGPGPSSDVVVMVGTFSLSLEVLRFP